MADKKKPAASPTVTSLRMRRFASLTQMAQASRSSIKRSCIFTGSVRGALSTRLRLSICVSFQEAKV